MTLKEKFKQIEVTVKGCDDGNPCIVSNKMFDNSAKQCEQITDDFAIGFAEWVVKTDAFLNYGYDEALQIYKKEKSANCNCEIPEPKGKCSENGIDVYCNKCGKSYSNQ